MTTAVRKNAKKRPNKKSFLPPSADVVKIAGREYVIAPLDEFQEWGEDRMLALLMEDRLEEDGPYMSMEEFEKRLDRKNKGRKK